MPVILKILRYSAVQLKQTLTKQYGFAAYTYIYTVFNNEIIACKVEHKEFYKALGFKFLKKSMWPDKLSCSHFFHDYQLTSHFQPGAK